MKYFKENTSQQHVQKPTVGSKLLDEPEVMCSDKERRMRQIEASVLMNRNKLGRLFAYFTQEELKKPDVLKPNKDDEL